MKSYKPEDKKEEALSKEVRNAIQRVDASADIILYGSRARGDAGPESDYDLLIVSDEPLTLKREDMKRRELFNIQLQHAVVLTVILISRNDWNSKLYSAMPFYRNVKTDGAFL